MKPRLMSQCNTKLSNAREDPGVTTIHVRVPHQTRIQNLSKNLPKRSTDSESTTTKGHIKGVPHVLIIKLRVTPNVPPLPMIILAQNRHQIIHKEDSVIIPENEPPHVFVIPPINRLLDDASHADRGSEAAGEVVREPGDVFGDGYRRESWIGIESAAIEEDDGARGLGGVPEADVGAAGEPGAVRGGDGEEQVAALGGEDG